MPDPGARSRAAVTVGAPGPTRFPCYTDPVSNLTLSLDEEILRRARMRALEQGTSVNAVVRDFLISYAGLADELRTRAAFVALSDQAGAAVAGAARRAPRRWRREELYEERVRWPRS